MCLSVAPTDLALRALLAPRPRRTARHGPGARATEAVEIGPGRAGATAVTGYALVQSAASRRRSQDRLPFMKPNPRCKTA